MPSLWEFWWEEDSLFSKSLDGKVHCSKWQLKTLYFNPTHIYPNPPHTASPGLSISDQFESRLVSLSLSPAGPGLFTFDMFGFIIISGPEFLSSGARIKDWYQTWPIIPHKADLENNFVKSQRGPWPPPDPLTRHFGVKQNLHYKIENHKTLRIYRVATEKGIFSFKEP